MAGSSRVSRSRLSRSRSLGVLAKAIPAMGGQRRGGVEAAADDQAEIAQDLQVGRRVRRRSAVCSSALTRSGARILAGSRSCVVIRSMPISPVHRGDASDVGGVLGGVDRGVDRLAVDRPVLQRDAQHRQRQHGGHDVGQVVDEVDLAVFDLLVEAGAGDLVDERLPALDRGRRQVGVEARCGRCGAPGRPSPGCRRAPRWRAGRGDRDALVSAAFAVDVVVVGDCAGSGPARRPPGCRPRPSARRRCRSTRPGTWRASPR